MTSLMKSGLGMIWCSMDHDTDHPSDAELSSTDRDQECVLWTSQCMRWCCWSRDKDEKDSSDH